MTDKEFDDFLKEVRECLVTLKDGKPWIESYDLRGCLMDTKIEGGIQEIERGEYVSFKALKNDLKKRIDATRVIKNPFKKQIVTREAINQYARKIVEEVFDKEYTHDNSQTLNVIIELLEKLGIQIIP